MKRIETIEFLDKEKQTTRLYAIVMLALFYAMIIGDTVAAGGNDDGVVIAIMCLLAIFAISPFYVISRHVTRKAMKNNPVFRTALENEMHKQYTLRAYKNGAVVFIALCAISCIIANDLPFAPRLIFATILFAGCTTIVTTEYLLNRR